MDEDRRRSAGSGVRAVKTHLNRVLTKRELRDRVQAVVFAYGTRLIRPE